MIKNIPFNKNTQFLPPHRQNPFDAFILNKHYVPDIRSWGEKIFHKIIAIVREFFTGISLLFNRLKAFFFKRPEYIDPYNKNFSWLPDNKGLCLFIHGLRGAPSDWKKHIRELKKHHPALEIKVPYVPKGGNCSLKEAAQPILELAKDYIKAHPNNPLCIIAASNGGRVADYIDIHLREYPVNLKISTIAGAHYGSKLATFISKLPLLNLLLNPDLQNELSYGSPSAKELIREKRKKITHGTRNYDFYATTEEYMVTPFNSCFPIIHQNEKYYLVSGHGHSSIVGEVRKHQIKKCLKWINQIA